MKFVVTLCLVGVFYTTVECYNRTANIYDIYAKSKGMLQGGVSNITQEQNIAEGNGGLRATGTIVPAWVKWNVRSPLPANAVYVGSHYNGEPTYVGRVNYYGEYAVVKVLPQSGGYASFPYGNEEISITSCEVLTGTGFSWVAAHNGNVPANAFRCGTDASCNPLYIGRATYSSSVTPGTINSALGGLFLPSNWQVFKYVDYDALVLSV